MSAYREPGREVDDTAVETARIHEAAETKRKRIEMREETRRARLKELGPTPTVVGGFLLACLMVLVAFLGHTLLTTREEQVCREFARERAYHSEGRCTHALHVLVQDEKVWTCKCGVARLPGDGGAP